MKRRIAIVGGGIAGLASAWALAKRPGFEVTLLERERTLCEHASGHNAAIYRPLEPDADLARLARESLASFRQLAPSVKLLDARGFVLLHPDPEHLAEVQRGSLAGGVEAQLLAPNELTRVLGSRTPYHGLFAKSGGIIDIHSLCQCLAGAARALGVRILKGVEVSGLDTSAERVRAVRTQSGEAFPAEAVVFAGGAWCKELGALVGCPLNLRAVRRHLALLEPDAPLADDYPVVWCLEPEVYFRAELGRVLVSPCDATEVEGTLAQADIEALSPLWEKLARLNMGLEAARVSHHWACLRTFAPDNRPVIGPDPRIEGLYWLAGLGGFGMTTGVAAGEELARVLAGEQAAQRFGVARFLAART